MAVVYETIRVKDGSIPLLRRHVARLQANCAAIGLPAPDGLSDAIVAACEPRGPDVKLRVTWDGTRLGVAILHLPNIVPMHVRTVTVAHSGYSIKTTEREVFDRARAEARAAGADEGLLLTRDGYVAEGTLFAVGWFDGESLCVPSLDLGILPSIGRGRVLEIAREADYPIDEGFFKRAELDGKPVFATTATRGVVEITTLDGVAVPSDVRVNQLAKAFWPE